MKPEPEFRRWCPSILKKKNARKNICFVTLCAYMAVLLFIGTLWGINGAMRLTGLRAATGTMENEIEFILSRVPFPIIQPSWLVRFASDPAGLHDLWLLSELYGRIATVFLVGIFVWWIFESVLIRYGSNTTKLASAWLKQRKV